MKVKELLAWLADYPEAEVVVYSQPSIRSVPIVGVDTKHDGRVFLETDRPFDENSIDLMEAYERQANELAQMDGLIP
jgi:hypothetical protein